MLLLYDDEETLKKFLEFHIRNKKKITKNNEITFYIKLEELKKHIFDKKDRDIIVVLKEQDPFLKEKLKNYSLKELWIQLKNNIFINLLE